LLEQLKEGGYVVIPIGEDRTRHELQAGHKMQRKLYLQHLGAVYFVPLIGQYAFCSYASSNTPISSRRGSIRALCIHLNEATSMFHHIDHHALESAMSGALGL
jgi:protein-L-isoaspartate(D-aspartate) O-methyltransferase (PCMT)